MAKNNHEGGIYTCTAQFLLGVYFYWRGTFLYRKPGSFDVIESISCSWFKDRQCWEEGARKLYFFPECTTLVRIHSGGAISVHTVLEGIRAIEGPISGRD